MKRSKKLIFLLGILVVICVATVLVRGIEDRKEKIKNSDKIILDISRDSVKTLSWEYESNSFAFHKDKKWLYDKDEAFPVNENKINQLLRQFEQFGAAFIIEDVQDYGQYGLDDPICTIKFSTEEKSYEVKLGDYSTMDSQRYVSIGDGNVYLVKNDPLEKFNVSLRDMINNDKTPVFSNVDVKDIKFAGIENYNIVYEKDSGNSYNPDDVYFAEQHGKKLPLDTSKIDSYLNSISYLDLTNYVTYNATDEDLQKYGLNSPELTVTINYTSKDSEDKETSGTFILNISRDPEEKKAAEASKDKEKDSSEEEEITAYARVGESKIVYKIPSDSYKKLIDASYNSLRHSEVLSAKIDDISKFVIALEGNEYTITSEKKDDKRIYYYNDKEIEINNLKNVLENLKSDSFTDKEPTDKEEIRLTLSLDKENSPEIKIVFYRYDGTYCLAEVDGKPVSLLKRSYVVDLIEAVHSIVLN
ncbi:MAG: DUF4340 domain-containing protein [Clostridiales bacterium]|nr:DUF4340 domain-containing protein [Clostridiales bacterium]